MVYLTVHKNDSFIVDFFGQHIQPVYKLHKQGNCVRLDLSMPRNIANIVCEWGLIPNKTHNFEVTSRLLNMKTEQFNQFLVGFIEGDGCIQYRKIKSKGHAYEVLKIRFSSGSNKLLDWIASLILKGNKIRRRKISKRKGCSAYEYAICGKDAFILSNELLKTKYHLLHRKWSIVLDASLSAKELFELALDRLGSLPCFSEGSSRS